MSTQPTQERHVRVCPTHMVEVEERGTALVCPRGQHAVSHFKVIDRLKRTSVEVAVDGDDRRGGLVGEGTKFALGRPRAVEPPGTVGQAVPARGAGATKPKEVLAKAKFEDVAGGVEGFSLPRVIAVVERMVEDRILFWAEGNSLRLLPHTREGEVTH